MNPVNQVMEMNLLNEDEATASIFWTDDFGDIWTDENAIYWTAN